MDSYRREARSLGDPVLLAEARGNRIEAIGIGLIIGGAIGNAIDRIWHGAVFDFVHFHVGDFSWYVFNVADAAIVIGVILMVASPFLTFRRSADAS